jgi:hypothetical protein
MDLSKYEDWAHDELEWLNQRMLNEGIEALRSSYEQLGERGIFAFLCEHKTEIRKFLGAARSQREPKIRKMSDETERHAFLLCTAYIAKSGFLLISLAGRSGFEANGGMSKPDLLFRSAEIVLEIESEAQSFWPFDTES